MVKLLSPHDHDTLSDALINAEKKTSAKIKISIHNASHSYQIYILVGALILGSAVALLLWVLNIVNSYPLLLSVQLGIMCVCDIIHAFSNFFMVFIPRSVRHHYAAQVAMREFHAHQSHLSPDAPFVFLFVSLAERYVHVVTNPAVHKAIPEGWHKVNETFIKAMKHDGLKECCLKAIDHISEISSGAYPPQASRSSTS